MSSVRHWGLFASAFLLASGGAAQSTRGPGFALGDRRIRDLVVAIDADDDDDDGTPDVSQPQPPLADTRRMRLLGSGDATLTGHGVRVLWAGRPLTLPASVALPADVRIQAAAAEGELVLATPRATSRLTVRGVDIRFEDASGQPIPYSTGALMPTLDVPNAPRTRPASRAFRVSVRADLNGTAPTTAWLSAYDGRGRRSRLPLPLHRDGDALRSEYIQLVTDSMDDAAPGEERRTLRVALRDRVEVDFVDARQSLRVGRPATESTPMAVREVRVRAHVLELAGSPVIGSGLDPNIEPAAGARQVVERQLAIAGEVWAQCGVAFHLTETRVHPPHAGRLLSVGDRGGFPAAGGTLRVRVNGRPLEVPIEAGSLPMQTARRIADSILALGVDARVLRVPRTEDGAYDAADVLVASDGPPDEPILRAPPEGPLFDDARQSIEIGAVALADGLEEFSNRNSMGGTLEERALIAPSRDPERAFLEVYFVDHFAARSRQGEAFIFGDGGPLAGTVVLDRRGVERALSSWTIAHEIGHVLLDQPFHPDDLGPDEPTRLMDSNGSSPTVLGPKRLTEAECVRARDRVQRSPFIAARD